MCVRARVQWRDEGHVFPTWSAHVGWATGDFWAPEFPTMADGSLRVFFVARNKAGVLSIGVARASSPSGPFKDLGV